MSSPSLPIPRIPIPTSKNGFSPCNGPAIAWAGFDGASSAGGGATLAYGLPCELSLELAHLLGAGPERDRHLSRHAAVRAGSDHRDRDLRLDHCAGIRIGRRRVAHAAVEDGVLDRLRLRRILPQHAAAGAAVSLVLRLAGNAAAHVGALAEADAQCAVLHGGDRGRAVHVGARRRAVARPASVRCRAGRNWPRPRSD